MGQAVPYPRHWRELTEVLRLDLGEFFAAHEAQQAAADTGSGETAA
jgi:hypothetical protein